MIHEQDKQMSLLYGEILPRGIDKCMDINHLDGENCRQLVDLGSGIGKLIVQTFLQFKNIKNVYGIELSEGRYG